jgi:dTDP-glucose 4,6-dehydratase
LTCLPPLTMIIPTVLTCSGRYDLSRILVTGGAGFIGSNFVRQWIREETTRVVNLDKLTYAGNLDSLADVADDPLHVFVEGDVCDGPLVSRLLSEHRPGAVVHFAAESHVDRSIDAPAAFVETNVVGTFRTLEATRRYWSGLAEPERSAFRFLHVSTDEVYGSLGPTGLFTEKSPCAPNSPYSASKAAADHFARAYHHTFGLPVLVTNCSNNYGPYQFPEKLVPLMILSAVEGKPLPVYGDGQHVRDWLYVEDHCRAIRTVLAGGTPGEVYNIGADCQRSNLEVVRLIAALVDRLRPDLPYAPCSSRITFVADRPGHDRRYAIDAGKIRRQLGWQPRESFQTGLERTVRWYLENRAWAQRVTSGEYRHQRLGLGPETRTDESPRRLG